LPRFITEDFLLKNLQQYNVQGNITGGVYIVTKAGLRSIKPGLGYLN
jgi:hypothetical protein